MAERRELDASVVTAILHLVGMTAVPNHRCISSCHHCISAITCKFRCINFSYAGRTSLPLQEGDATPRGAAEPTLPLRFTAPHSKFSLPSRWQNLRTVKVPFSFSEKTNQICRPIVARHFPYKIGTPISNRRYRSIFEGRTIEDSGLRVPPSLWQVSKRELT